MQHICLLNRINMCTSTYGVLYYKVHMNLHLYNSYKYYLKYTNYFMNYIINAKYVDLSHRIY